MNHILPIAGTILGMLVGATTMWFTVRDRMEKEISERVEYRVKTESKLSRYDERIKALESDAWARKNQPQ